ncbi:MAG: hypothetical protein IKQ16_10535 [Lentisphaeria bacterium]|jgi:hypothetical protein|nr:hypothetical protein [Lentisphaeria bacterium]
MSANPKKDRTKLSVFSLVLALVLIVVVLISVRAVFHNNSPATVQSLMVALNIPATVSVDEGMREAVQESFQSEFSALYGIDLTAEEGAYFSRLLQDCTAEFEMEPFLREMLEKECTRRRIPEETMVRQIMGIRDPAEREKIRAEWIASGQAAVLRSESFLHAMEPVSNRFFEWWTPRHPEYQGVAAGITITDDRGALLDQIAMSLRREVLVHTAQQLQDRLVTDLRKRGKVISEEKQQRTFAVFLRLGKVRYTEELMRSIADAIAEEAELTDDEILHCLLLKDRKLSNERLSTIQDVQVRYLTPRTLDSIPAETVSEIRKELQSITGVDYAQ